jgi:putative SbcD/Mre11-related phosphoesterase
MGEPFADATFTERAVSLPAADALVLADLHLGRARDADVAMPVPEHERVADRIDGLLDRFSPATTVLAGDVLHAFDSVPAGVADALSVIVETIRGADSRVVVTPGNHDTMLDSVYDGERAPAFRLSDGTVVCHGHERPTIDGERYVVGHDHPAIEFEGRRYRCTLVGREETPVAVLPACSPLAAGTTVNRRHAVQTPLVTDLDAYAPVVTVDGETRRFPPLRALRPEL